LQPENKPEGQNHHVVRAAGIVGSATLGSRILGYIRDMLIAGYLGAGPISDAFIAAFRIPNLLRRLFHEGTLSMTVVPVMTDHLVRRGRQDAADLARAVLQLSAVLLVLASLVCALGAPWIMRALAYGFSQQTRIFSLSVDLLRVMSPYIFFVGLIAACMGILNALGHFSAPALAPVFLNLGMIGAVLLTVMVTDSPRSWSYGLAIGVVVGGSIQLLVQVPFLIKKGVYFWRRANWRHPGLKRIRAMFLAVTFGGSVFQLNTLTGTLLASFLVEGSISYLYYADRLVQFPLGVFGIATATAVMPTLSRRVAEVDYPALKDSLVYAMQLVSLIIIPAMAGIIVLREPIIALLFERGAFDARASRLTSDAVLYYGMGLWAFAAIRIVIATFYALHDARTPVRYAVVSLLVNFILGLALMGPMGHGGIALALTLATTLNLVLLYFSLRKRIGPLGMRKVAAIAGKSFLASVMMGICVWWLALKLIDRSTFYHQLFGLVASIAIGILIYVILSLLLQGREVFRLLQGNTR